MKKISLLGLVFAVCCFISTPVFSVDCSKWFGKGYCVDYIKQRVGHRPSGNASTWPATISKNQVRAGDVAIFREAAGGVGHVAYVEKVNLKNGKPDSINVSEWNWGTGLDACSRTNKFGTKGTRSNISINSVSGFWRP